MPDNEAPPTTTRTDPPPEGESPLPSQGSPRSDDSPTLLALRERVREVNEDHEHWRGLA
ncbi:hypothetical protein [Streptomyces sp. NPDC020965]|uniref:hypothetical protein n=1 Tax=Streptomyces sp. NPDC020965 TaxID=3365105 RepID=UPI0037BB3ADB